MNARPSRSGRPGRGGGLFSRALRWLVALPLGLALISCDFTALVGGLYESKTQINLGVAPDIVETKLVLVLGQYGSEVAGHLEMPAHPECPCVYVQGDFTGRDLSFESEPDRSQTCDLVLTGSFKLSADSLQGHISLGTATLTGDIELVRFQTQSELGSEELRGCQD